MKVKNWKSCQYNKGADIFPKGEIVQLQMKILMLLEGKTLRRWKGELNRQEWWWWRNVAVMLANLKIGCGAFI